MARKTKKPAPAAPAKARELIGARPPPREPATAAPAAPELPSRGDVVEVQKKPRGKWESGTVQGVDTQGRWLRVRTAKETIVCAKWRAKD